MITHKGIRHNILNDAPFIGALIIAPTCRRDCENCINEHLKYNNIFYKNTADEIINKVKSNGLNKGIILSGLEWSESSDSMIELTKKALDESLKVIIYTYMEEKEFLLKFPFLKKQPIYVKYGFYNEDLITENNVHYEIKLVTDNQHIEYYGEK